MTMLTDQRRENADRARARQTVAPMQCCLVRLVGMVGRPEAHVGEVEITGKRYYLIVSARTFILKHHDGRKNRTYEVPVDCSSCTCPDRLYRPGKPFCRHMQAMRELVDDGMVPTIS
jgi:hypothetical protein